LDSAAAIETFPAFANFLDSGYEKVRTVEDLTLFKRKDLLSASKEKHVLLLTVDTLRADYLSSSGYDLMTTPALDALFDRSTVFRRAVTPAPRTTPALASLLTGRYPHQTGVRRLLDRLADDTTSLAEIASQNGFDTLAIVSNHILTKERGLGRGFDLYDSAGDARIAAATTAAAKQALAGKSATDSVFVWVHYIDPHVPYLPKPETVDKLLPDYQGRYGHRFGQALGGEGNHAYPKDLPKRRAVFQNQLPESVNARIRQLYAADIRDTDDAIADLLAWLVAKFGDDWTIVFTSDHGESLGEHDFYYDHGDYVFNATTRVPLAIATPQGGAYGKSRSVKDWVSLVDIAPTLIELLGWEVSKSVTSHFEGRSLAPYFRGKSMESRAVFAESGHSYFPNLIHRRVRFDIEGRFRAVWKDQWKLIWTPFASADEEFQLYNTKKDPNEKRDLAERHPKRVRDLHAELTAWMKRQTDQGASHEATPEELEALRSLGYIE
jgi:arylsulfatase A-like enzyme